MTDLLWLLLPVAAAAGWFAGRRHRSAIRPEGYWDYATQFHQGLSDLFNDRDAVDEALFDTLGIDPDADDDPRSQRMASAAMRDTADTYLALGKLFRRRGDVERAIQLHEALLAREGVDDATRADARYELARDFESAGLLDRSEDVFRDLLDRGERVEDAYGNLLELLESQQDWARATKLATELAANKAVNVDSVLAGSVRSRLAHYACELSAEAASAGYDEQADECLQAALEHHPQSARAHRMCADRALAADCPEEALAHYESVAASRPDLTPEIIDAQFRALEKLDDPKRTRAFIDHLAGRRNPYSVIRRTREEIAKREGADPANRFFKEQIVKRPSLRALRDWARDQLESPRTKEPDKVATVVAMLDGVIEDKPAYQCGQCGFRGNTLHWRCPSCGIWDSVSTIIGAEGE